MGHPIEAQQLGLGIGETIKATSPPISGFDQATHELVTKQNLPRESWVHEPNHLINLFLGEYEEYLEAKEQCMLGADPIVYASEVGDLGYLYLRICDLQEPPTAITELMKKVLIETQEVGIDINKAILFKVFRNDIKYPLVWTLNGWDYEKSRDLSKEQYAYLGGDEAFHYAYMMMGGSL